MKRVTHFLLCLLLLSTLTCPALAANQVTELNVEVALREDGSAYITQEFYANTEEGTEFYLDYLDSGYLTITDFQVSDQNGPYTLVEEGEWDIDASFEEKAGKCGMLPIDGGMELCWGITEYGENRYVVEYVLHDLVGAYEDADGFNHRFVNADLSFFPTDVTLMICNQDGNPISDDFADIWAFGYDGQIAFEDGVIRAWTETPLEGDDNMTIMVGFDKGVLSPVRTGDGTFEEVKERAFDGSDYEDDGDFLFGVIIVVVLAVLFIGVIVIILMVGKAKRKKRERNTPYFRDLPNDGDLNVSYVLGSRLSYIEEESLLGARILRLLAMGCLEPVQTAMDAKEVPLRLVREPHSGNAYDEALYTILQVAAGENGVLDPKELEQFCDQQPGGESLAKLMDSCERSGMTVLVRKGCLKGAVCEDAGDLTTLGQKQLDELLGLKRYLLDFSLLAEREVKDTIIWQDYMVYAVLLGIADQVIEQLKTVYPAQLPEIERYARYATYSSRYDWMLYSGIRRERQRQEALRSGGSGGRASFGGGGGFSGGGGGGTR